MIKKLKQILTNADASSEESSDYNGAFSHAAETHAFINGFHAGFVDLKPDGMGEKTRNNADVKAEIHYAKAGYAVGALIRNGLVAGGAAFVAAKGVIPI